MSAARSIEVFRCKWERPPSVKTPIVTPSPWDASKNSGFSTAERPWLPVPASSAEYSVRAESQDPGSILSFYKRLLALRRSRRQGILDRAGARIQGRGVSQTQGRTIFREAPLWFQRHTSMRQRPRSEHPDFGSLSFWNRRSTLIRHELAALELPVT